MLMIIPPRIVIKRILDFNFVIFLYLNEMFYIKVYIIIIKQFINIYKRIEYAAALLNLH